jgi:uncharacterized phage protein (TIGR01671 family)
MREIKFRAWHKGNEWQEPHMTYDVQKAYDDQYGDFDERCFWEILINEDIVVMQYTGLHDKENREIYEGDILRCNYCEREIGTIEWHEHGFWIKWPSGTLSLPNQENREIIGNLYEHPELLKG